MKVTEYFLESSRPAFSIEITPPLKTKSIEKIFHVIDRIKPYHPDFINITYHQETVSLEEVDGIPTKIVYQKHASTVGVCSAIKYKYGIDVVPHFICGGFDRLEIEDALFDLIFLGIENVFALRGDPRKNENEFIPKASGLKHASELVDQIREMQRNNYLHQMHPVKAADFCVGVAGYPEKHHESKSLNEDIKMLKYKIDCGADYIVTQMFYDYGNFIDWEDRCRQAGITVPIIPGLKPLTEKKQIRRFAKNFGVKIPRDLEEAMNKATNSLSAYKAGIDYMAELSEKLISHGVPGLHYFTMGNGADVADVAEKVFKKYHS